MRRVADNAGMDGQYLSNQFLVAMPNVVGGEFDRTVTFLCEHNDDGAMGLVINRPTDLKLGDMLDHMGIDSGGLNTGATVFWGGPVQPDRGFVLHPPTDAWEATLTVDNHLSITTSKDILEAIGRNEGPDEYMVMLGYAGWGSGQLEQEIRHNSWLNTPPDSAIIFGTPTNDRWSAAARLLGLDPAVLSSSAGNA